MFKRIAQTIRQHERTHAQQRLGRILDTAKNVGFDDTSRFVFFADCHRGDNGRADIFARNKGLFLDALQHYYQHGFTYVEVGDGDEMWQNRRFASIRHAHERVFDLFHRFDRQDRLHLIVGNHDISGKRAACVEKDGIFATEGLVLTHAQRKQRILVAHGHQADYKNDRWPVMGRTTVRALKHVQRLGVARYASLPGNVWSECAIDRRIREWAHVHQQTIICGHTHRPTCASSSAFPYFNPGSCLVPGSITGIEIQNGCISLVKWMSAQGQRPHGMSRVRRELVGRPRELRQLCA